MANDLQVYFRAAISEFAGADSTQPLPEYNPFSEIEKSRCNLKVVLPKKSASIAASLKVPRTQNVHGEGSSSTNKIPFPCNSPTTEDSWSKVVRIGFKKSQFTATPSKQANSILQFPKEAVQSPPKIIKKKDTETNLQGKRLLIHLSNNHDWQKLFPAGILDIVVKKSRSPLHQ